MKTFRVYGGDVILLPGERDRLGLVSRSRQGRAVIAASSLTAACGALGLTRDYVSETGNEQEVQIARNHPGRVVLLAQFPGQRAVPGAPTFILRGDR